jgi:16S rRNA (guanine527-N7)-methyltransferase
VDGHQSGVFHVKHEGWGEAAAALGVVLDGEQAALLDAYEALLRERAAPLGMISGADLPRIRERHLLDCLRAAAHCGGLTTAYDLGSGAGLPGIPLAIAVPALQLTLVEARRNRAGFLELAADALPLPNVSVFPGRAEHLRERVDLVTARAFKSASECWDLADSLLTPAGRLIYFAGTGFDPGADTPKGAELRLFSTPSLANSGPLAIMSRQ